MGNILDHRYIVRLKVEAKTPLFVGSGESSLLKDALVQKDHHGLPMIPGTSLAGVLRHSLLDGFDRKKISEYNEDKRDAYFSILDFFGCQINSYTEEDRIEKNAFEKWYVKKIDKREEYKKKIPDGLGSRLRISSAYFLLGDDKVAEGIKTAIDDQVLFKMDNLPVRQHVRINDKGAAESRGLFDNEVVYKGSRFVFEVELKGTKEDLTSWKEIIKTFQSPTFRIGQGTRNGYGNLRVIEIFDKTFDLTNPDDFDTYLEFNPSFNASLGFDLVENNREANHTTSYHLVLEPDDFFIFSEGFGDEDVDNKPVTEEVIEYNNEKIEFVEQTLIPASSIKGALAHRVAFHYNRLKDKPVYADEIDLDEFKDHIGQKNNAVTKLFGRKGEVGDRKNIGQRGILVLDDLYYDDIDNSKIFNHVAIDRFTGGGIDGALFSEKVSRKKGGRIELKIHLLDNDVDNQIKQALKASLIDICKGLLSLGGMTTKGFGMMTGTLEINGIEAFNYKKEMV